MLRPCPRLYTVCGAAAFSAGAVRYEATAVLITLEAIGAWPLVVPVTIACAPCACYAQDSCAGLPVLPPVPETHGFLKCSLRRFSAPCRRFSAC